MSWFRKVDETRKFAGTAPDIRLCEFNQEEIFKEGVEKFGEVQLEIDDILLSRMAVDI